MNNRNISPVLPERRLAGVGVHFASLPGPYGIGDIGDSALSFIDSMSEMNIRVWQYLPTGPTAYGDSPYQPLSAFAGNENLLGIDPLVRAGLIRPEETSVLRDLPTETVDYGNLIPAKSTLLTTAADRFADNVGADLKSGYEDFLHQYDADWLDDYALFRVLKNKHGERAWPEWERKYAQRDPVALREVRNASRQQMERIKLLQFLFHRQSQELHARAREKGVILFSDMPIYIALDSADAWACPEILRIDRNGRPSHVAGVPPDYFSEDGQLWGNPLYDWDHLAENGYQWWIDRLRHAASMADLVRIDHFRGFEAYWAIPAESPTARNGAWERGPGGALFAAMQAALGHLPIVAEDLGFITPQVHELRQMHDIPGMRVLQFDVDDPDFRADHIEANCVCYTGTHDNDTTIGWFRGGHDDTRSRQEIETSRINALRLTGGSADTINFDMIRLAFSSKAMIAMAPLQDYLGLGSGARLNTPGTTHGNWRWRLPPGRLTPAVCESISNMVRDASRD